MRAIFWTLAGGTLFTIMMALIKQAGSELHITQILLVRQIMMLICVMPAIIAGLPGSLRSKRYDLQILRLLLAAAAMTMFFGSVVHLPIADATAINFAKPLFVTVLAAVLLGELVGPRRWAAAVIGFIGVMIVVNPSGFDATNIYSYMALAGTAAAAFVMIVIRKLSQLDAPSTILIYQAAGVGIILAPFAYTYWIWPSLEMWAYLIAAGVIAYGMQMCTILSYRAGEASLVSSVDYTRIVIAVAIGFLVFGDWPENRVFLGAGLIIAALLYTIHREARLNQKIARAPESRNLSQ